MSRSVNWTSSILFAILIAVIMVFWPRPSYAQQIHPPVKLVVGETTVAIGDEAIVPVAVKGLEGRYFSTSEMHVTYNSEMLELVSVTLGRLHDPNTQVDLINTAKPGDKIVGVFPQAEGFVIEEGNLVYLHFITKQPGSALVELHDVKLNGGHVEAAGVSGYITIFTPISVSGVVVYGPQMSPVSGAKVTIQKLEPLSMTTGIDGEFAFVLPIDSSFATIVEKEGDFEGAITTLDVMIMKRCAYGLPPLGYSGECVTQIADVDRDGEITLYDAWLTLRFIVGFRGESEVGTWIFSPGNVGYADMQRDLIQTQKAIIVGDMTLNGPGNYEASVASSYQVSMTGTTKELVINFAHPGFAGVAFEITSTSPITVTGVNANGFDANNKGNFVAIVGQEFVQSAQVKISIEAPIGAEVQIINWAIDEQAPETGVVAQTPIKDPIPGLQIEYFLPLIQFHYADQEQMPELIPDSAQ